MDKSLYNIYLNNLPHIPSFLDKYLTVPSIQRLKKVGYFCGMDYASKDVYNFKEFISRYDHSLTVALLTYKYTNDILATIAALIHDIATPCFAHVIDYMNKDYEKQESTEEYTEKIIKGDKLLLAYLKADGINPDDIINFKKYSIVDLDRPKLCADRIDGIILTSISWTKNIDSETILAILKSIEVYLNEDGEYEFGFNDKETTLKVLELNSLIDLECHTNYDSYMMELLARITKESIDYNIINYNDLFYLEEDYLFNLLNNCNNEKIKELLDKFYHIKKNEIENTNIDNLKKKNINPLVNGVRIKNEKTI